MAATTTTVRTQALNLSTSFAQAGLVFDDATRLLVGGLWQNAVMESNQTPYLPEYTADIKAVSADLTQQLANGLFTGSAKTVVQDIVNTELPMLLKAAPNSVNGGGTMGSVTAADNVLHNVQTEILTQVQGNTKLAALAVTGTLTGFEAIPVGLANGVTADKAPHANLAEIGVIFNSAADAIIGGVNSSNEATIQKDLTAVYTDLKQLIASDPVLFGDGLHLIHAETILNQVSLQVNDYDTQYGINVDAARSSSDNILDIIDIIHNDTVLDNNANQGGVNGWTEFPINANNAGQFLSGTINRYQDNSAQTQFWAKFIVGANTLTTQANAAVTSGNQTLINSVITEIQAYQKFGADFDNAQGGVFASRFDNELLSGTLLEDANAAIQGLKSGNAALVAAAGSGFIADAKDVSGNNIPVTGGVYNGNATTITQALSMAHSTGAANSGGTQTTSGAPTGSQSGTPGSPSPSGGGVSSGGAPSSGSGSSSGSSTSGSSTSGSSAGSGNNGSSGSNSSSTSGDQTASDHHHHHSFDHVWHHM
jgi:hypothetical protein